MQPHMMTSHPSPNLTSQPPKLVSVVVTHHTLINQLVPLSSHPGDWTIDSACSCTMKPTTVGVVEVRLDHTPMNLADDLAITSTHVGRAILPITNPSPVRTLIVPDLHEPLLSVADICAKGLAVVFNSYGCQIYLDTSINPQMSALGTGYRRGNLYYLPKDVGPISASLTPSNVSDLSLLGYHRRLDHKGLKPLERLLKLHGIMPTMLDKIEL